VYNNNTIKQQIKMNTHVSNFKEITCASELCGFPGKKYIAFGYNLGYIIYNTEER
jgi:hypothetical protein